MTDPTSSSSSSSSNDAHDDDIPRSRIDKDASGAARDVNAEEMEEDDDDAIAVGSNCDDRDGNCEDERRRNRIRFVEEVVDAPSETPFVVVVIVALVRLESRRRRRKG